MIRNHMLIKGQLLAIPMTLTHLCLLSLKRAIGRQYRLRSDAISVMSDLSLHSQEFLSIRAVAGQHSSPKSCFANKIKIFLSAKIQEGKITGLQYRTMRHTHRTMTYRSLGPTFIIRSMKTVFSEEIYVPPIGS